MVADPGASLKEDEIELELSLSIGRSYERPKENGLLNSLKPDDNQPVVFGENDRRSSVSPTFNTTQMEITKRGIQALRRLEAKRKREEKQLLKRGLFCNGVSCNGDLGFSKKSKVGNGCVNGGLKDVNLNLTAEQKESAFNNGHPQVNGFGSPCREGNAAPFTPGHWFAGVGPGNVLRPLAGYGGGIGIFNAVSGSARVADSDREGSSGKSGSSGSPDCTPSAGSDRKRSPSREGGNSCETKSRSESDQPHSNDIKSECELGAASQQVVPAAAVEETYQLEKTNAYPSTPTGPKMEAAISEKALDSTTQNHFSTTENPTHGRPMKHCNGDKGKPPKPQTRNRDTSSLPRMPCVSTTGTGPNGKTVNGFLYRYTKTEVSIICVCHGTSFSPAEFVQHAGGVDVSNPLKHITVIPAPL